LRFGVSASTYFLRVGATREEAEKISPLFLATKIAQMRDEGLSVEAIADILNEQGYRGKRGGKFCASNVARLSRKYYPNKEYQWQSQWTQEVQEKRQAIIQELEQGTAPVDIAEKFGISKQRISQIIEQEDMPFKPKRFPFFVCHDTPEERLAILKPILERFERDNVSLQAACYLLGISEWQCYEYCKSAGVKLRSIQSNYWPRTPKVQKMLAEYIAGKPLKEIAKRYNYASVTIVRAQARRYNIPGRPRGRRYVKPQESTQDG